MNQYPAGTTSVDIKNLNGFFMVVDERSGFKKGDIVELWSDDISKEPVFRNIKTREIQCIFWSYLVPSPKGFHYGGLEIGDIVEDMDGGKAKALEVGKSGFHKSNWDEYDEAGSFITYQEAKRDGYIILGAEPKSKIEEFSEWIRKTELHEGHKEGIIYKAKEIFGDK